MVEDNALYIHFAKKIKIVRDKLDAEVKKKRDNKKDNLFFLRTIQAETLFQKDDN